MRLIWATFCRTDFSSRADSPSAGGQEKSPPSRPPSHAPWIYPSDIQIDPSSLEVSPRPQQGEEDQQGGRFNFADQLARC